MQKVTYESRIKTVWANRGDWFAGLLDNDISVAGRHPFGNAELKGLKVRVSGTMKTTQFGSQLQIGSIEAIDEDPMVFFLSRMITGIGEKRAQKMVEDHGSENIAQWLNESPRKLLRVHGIGPKMLKRIVSSWKKNKHLEEIAKVLAPLGLTRSMIWRIYRHYENTPKGLVGGALVRGLRDNVYMLTAVPGIGFKTVDQKALRGGLTTADSPYRIAAAIIYTLEQRGDNNGDSAVEREVLFADLDEILEEARQSHDTYNRIMDSMLAAREIIAVDDGSVSLPSNFFAERKLISLFRDLSRRRASKVLPDAKLPGFIRKIEKKAGVKYDERQKQAILSANDRYLNFVVGYAGTGKTTVTFGILQLLEEKYGSEGIFVTALSGVATDRVRKASGYSGGTIQSLLVAYESGGIPYDVLVLDEASMVNSVLMARLFERLKPDVRLVIVGDGGQLPPIGAGDPFMDAVHNGLGNINELTRIYRQSPGSKISEYAGMIRQGEIPDFNAEANDIAFRSFSIGNIHALKQTHTVAELARLRAANNEKIADYCAAAVRKLAPRIIAARESGDLMRFLYTAQIISPMRDGLLGSENMNRLVQSIITPDDGGAFSFSRNGQEVSFRLGDKIMHLKNENLPCLSLGDYKIDPWMDFQKDRMQRVFNGFIGMVVKIDNDDKLLWVHYLSNDSIVRYTFDQARDILGLGYSMTIHKSQGSGFDYVILPITMTHYRMLNTRLFYTAITRAQKFCLLAGEPQALRHACTNVDDSTRDTVMKRLCAV